MAEERNTMPRRGPGSMGGPRGGRSMEKANDFRGSIGKLVRYSRNYWWVILSALVFSVVGTILTLLGPDKLSDLTKEITNGIMTGIDMDAVAKIGFTLVAFYACSAVLSLAQGLIMATVTQKITMSLREDISHKINRLPMSYFHGTTTGDILSRVTNDADTISQGLNQSVSTLVQAFVMFFGSLFMMLITDVTLTFTAVVSTILGFGLMMIIMSRSQKYFSMQQKSLGALNGHIEEIYTGHTVVKAYNGEKVSKEAFSRMNEELRSSGFLANAMSGLMMPLMSFIGNLGYVAVCVVGAILTMNGNIGFEVIIAFIMYVRYFTQPLQQFAQGFQRLQSAAAASERVFAFLEANEMEEEDQKAEHTLKAEGNVQFENVKFGYTPEKEIIHGFTEQVKSGQKIAIVGPTGAGKTTIVNLLMRFYEANSGKIYLDGVDSRSMRRSDVRDQFCMVLQDTWIFEGTIRENLVYNQTGITDEEVKQACKAVGLHHFIRTLPNGYDTMLSDSVSLSQGQKQQLTIARAMLTDRPMLILDEATSSVDTRTEQQIQNAMDELMKNRTSFVIAHRLSTIRNADLILVLKDGDVIESGNHEELLRQNGFYAELYNSQFEEAS